MDISELKKEYVIKTELGIEESYGKILTVIDFANVNYWFKNDTQNPEGRLILRNEKVTIDLQALHDFITLFSADPRFYYGHNAGSLSFIQAAKNIFGRNRVFTKIIQRVRHYLTPEELNFNTRNTFLDTAGTYVHIPKCNFDVEMTVDIIRLIDTYDTLAFFSGDADFVCLIRFIRSRNKKVILFKGGHITAELRKNADKVISAQNIKRHITKITKQKPGS